MAGESAENDIERWALGSRTGQGGHESFGARSKVARLFEEYAPALRAFLLRRLGNVDDAREASQEVFLHLWRQESKGLLREGARAYLFTAAGNWVKDCRRRAATCVLDKHESLDAIAEGVALAGPAGDDVVHWRRGLEVVVDGMSELPPATQRIFDLYHGSRMSYADIAKELGVTTRTVERHMAHALAHGRARLEAYL